ncbi:alpha/beta fold hydrolase [Actinomadura syzygii]|uniref:Alpha/beta fold hydrolase n=1 Tax=Actinomadura syzygii TaxID=1427538 RepID=A0A5D0U3J1_9ACTN|nr:alpha/beta fold hydrolase [Actinomadura syzygii]TYC13201.1 alpha/beta fold hydrolase [Actinomadura syzygii]
MIDINEKFTVAAAPERVYEVLSDPNAVVECVAGASLGDSHEDGSFDGMMTVKFSALRISFKGRVKLDLDPGTRSGTVHARGRDGQGGTKFQANATFQITPVDGGASSEVTATGEVELSGKLASVIEGAATAVVKRMTGEFVEALSLRCASGDALLGSAPKPAPAAAEGNSTAPATASGGGDAPPVPGVLLLHGFGGSPNSLRPWGEALADAGMAVSIPRLPGHGTRWQDLDRTGEDDWLAAAEQALTALREDHEQVFVMGLSLGATLALRLAQRRRSDVAGVVMVNAVLDGLPGTSGILRLIRRSVKATANDVKKRGAVDVGYARVGLRSAAALRRLGAAARDAAGATAVPVLVVSSKHDHVVPSEQSRRLYGALPGGSRERLEFSDSYHVVPVDNDAAALFARSVEFVHGRTLIKT